MSGARQFLIWNSSGLTARTLRDSSENCSCFVSLWPLLCVPLSPPPVGSTKCECYGTMFQQRRSTGAIQNLGEVSHRPGAARQFPELCGGWVRRRLLLTFSGKAFNDFTPHYFHAARTMTLQRPPPCTHLFYWP